MTAMSLVSFVKRMAPSSAATRKCATASGRQSPPTSPRRCASPRDGWLCPWPGTRRRAASRIASRVDRPTLPLFPLAAVLVTVICTNQSVHTLAFDDPSRQYLGEDTPFQMLRGLPCQSEPGVSGRLLAALPPWPLASRRLCPRL